MNITVYCGSSMPENRAFQQVARELGEWIAREGHELVYGGSRVGLMGIVSGTVLEAGGRVHGVETSFFVDAGVARDNLTELFVVDTMAERKAKMIELGDAFVALPGGVGTLEEMSEIVSRIRLGMDPSACYFLNIDGFYDNLRAFLDDMVREGFLDRVDMDRICFPETLDELVRLLESDFANPRESFATAAEMMRR